MEPIKKTHLARARIPFPKNFAEVQCIVIRLKKWLEEHRSKLRSAHEDKRLFECLEEAVQSISQISQSEKPLNKTAKIVRMRFINTQFAIWNQYSNFFFQHREWARDVPSIGTKSHANNGKVQEKMLKGEDTLLQEQNPSEKTLSLCSKNGKACWLSSEQGLMDLLQVYVQEPQYWVWGPKGCNYNSTNNPQMISGNLSLHCPIRDCKRLIPIKTFRQYISNEMWESLKILAKRLWCSSNPGLADYCADPTCDLSFLGFCVSQRESTTVMFHCFHCEKDHDIHDHKRTCPKCDKTFCRVCRMTPYHEKNICQGPRPMGIDDETYELLKTVTRPCPSCKVRTEKRIGCDHMKCASCLADWCWRCLQVLNKNDPYVHECIEFGIEGRPDPHYHDVPGLNHDAEFEGQDGDWGVDVEWGPAGWHVAD
jgi:hypothetical protein